MTVLNEIARSGGAAVLLHPLRSVVSILALVAVLLPYLTCLALSRGVQEEAELSVHFGADMYVTARQFGRPVPVPLAAVDQLEKARLPGLVRVVPRIVGGLVLGKDEQPAVVVGLPLDQFPEAIECVAGQLSEGSSLNELVVGTELARRLGLRVGARLPPFYHNADGERLSRVVGLFRSEVGLWQANLIFTSFDTAAHLFNQRGLATDLLLYCRPGYQTSLATELLRLRLPIREGQHLQLHIVTREEVRRQFQAGLLHREGVVQLHFLLAWAVAILVLLVTSGFGLAERRREMGLLKATGWQTDQILLRSAVESVLLALAGIALAVVLAFVWLKPLNGYGIASIFLTGVDRAPGFRVPSRLTPIPVGLGFLLGLLVMLTGTLYSSWRAATASPLEAMR